MAGPAVRIALAVRAVVAAALPGTLVAGCSPPAPSPAPTAPGTHARSATARPTPSSPAAPLPASLPPSFSVSYAAPCGTYLPLEEILAALRAGQVLPAGATATAVEGPLCSGDWQFTVLTVTGVGTMQAITRGGPGSLRLVTAGTDVCTPTVKLQAPVGLLAVARCAAG